MERLGVFGRFCRRGSLGMSGRSARHNDRTRVAVWYRGVIVSACVRLWEG